jgi:hypothetical protein
MAEMLDGRPISYASRESARTMLGRAGQHKRQRNYQERRLVLNQ